MGRRPNSLILEYFTRGPKLKDSSNRYQHTCKNCGERFPKGRIDTLNNHLTKQCRALSTEERMRILHRVYQLPDQSQQESDTSPLRYSSHDEIAAFSVDPTPAFDGLNVLAEASRQVGATEQPKRRINTHQAGNPPFLDPALESTMNDVFNTSGLLSLQFQNRGITNQPPSSSTHPPTITNTSLDAAQRPQTPSNDLRSIAVSADDMISDEMLRMDNDPSRLFEPPDDANYQETTSEYDTSDKQVSEQVSRAISHPRPIAVRPKGGRIVHDPTKPYDKILKGKGRARFSADRRKEVSDLRKKGACLRCKVLRKPCSFEDPCKTCSRIENSRTWTWPCSRTRLANEIQFYSSGLYCSITYKEMNTVKAQPQPRNVSFPLEVYHSKRGTHREVFDTLKLSLRPATKSQSAIPETADQYLLFINNETEDINDKMQNYVTQSTIDVYEDEPESPVKVTLEMALSILAEQKDVLLSSVIELWTASTLLMRQKELWNIELQGTLRISEETSITGGDLNSASRELIITQLLSGLETRADSLCQKIASELEQRFMRKLHDGIFGTFVTSVIILSCIERMSWLYQAWSILCGTEHAEKWPLPNPPSFYLEGGSHFCDLLLMLLRVRELIPTISIHPQTKDILHTSSSPIDDGIRRWISNIQISPEYVEQRRNADVDPKDFRSLDMKYIAKLLQIIVPSFVKDREHAEEGM